MPPENTGDQVDQVEEPSAEFPIGKDVAAEEFEKLCSAWQIDADVEEMDEEDRTGFEAHKRRITDAVRRGRLTFVPDSRTLDYRLESPAEGMPDTFSIRMPTGAAMMGFDGTKANQNMAKLNRFIGHMTKQPPGFFGSDRCGGIDVRVFQAVAALFLAS